MNKICNVKYVDAYYVYTKNLPKVKFKAHEAYGYCRMNRNDLVMEFILRSDQNKTDATIVKGLIIPNSAIISNSEKSCVEKMDKGSDVAITWKDIVYIANDPVRECSVMYSEGTLVEDGKNHIVLKNPETLRLSPGPIVNHPERKPNFYVIPKSLIIKTKILQ